MGKAAPPGQRGPAGVQGRGTGHSAPDSPSGVFGLSDRPEQASVVLLPVEWEATASYGHGSSLAPEAIRLASEQVDLFDVELGQPDRRGIAMLPPDGAVRRANAEACPIARRVMSGASATADEDRARVNELSRQVHDRVLSSASEWLERGKLVGLVGGDHSCALANVAAHARRYPGVGVLQLDAHADLRVAYQGFEFSHASVMHRVLADNSAVATLVSVGVRDLCAEEHEAIRLSRGRVTAFFDADMARRIDDGEPFGRIAQQIAAALPDQVYVSFDIDGLQPSLCPHTGTPVPGGLSFHQTLALLRAVVASGRHIVGFDLCEVAPGPAGDEWDANVGARLLYKLLGSALASGA